MVMQLRYLAIEAYARHLCTAAGYHRFIEPFVRQVCHPLRVIVLRTVLEYVRRSSSGTIRTVLSMLARIFERPESYGGLQTVHRLVNCCYPPYVELEYLQHNERNWWEFVRSKFAHDEMLWSRIKYGYCSLVKSVVTVDILDELAPGVDVIRLLSALRTYPRERAMRQITAEWAALKLERYTDGEFSWCLNCYEQLIGDLCTDRIEDCKELCEYITPGSDWETVYDEEYSLTDNELLQELRYETGGDVIAPPHELELRETLITTRNPNRVYELLSQLLICYQNYLCSKCRMPILEFYPAIPEDIPAANVASIQ